MVNGPPRKVRNIANVTPCPFSPVENGPPGPGEGPFSTGKNEPGVHFQRLKMDRGVHFQRRKMDRGGGGVHFTQGENGPPGPGEGPFSTGKNEPGVHFQPLKMDRGSIFNG